ncbi:hypothetical protein ABW19_dt0203223 [Dactylella cylindrospora]|nr:hypothetical protein ABW19_dt0203223 [Dactylella cylindrospora]
MPPIPCFSAKPTQSIPTASLPVTLVEGVSSYQSSPTLGGDDPNEIDEVCTGTYGIKQVSQRCIRIPVKRHRVRREPKHPKVRAKNRGCEIWAALHAKKPTFKLAEILTVNFQRRELRPILGTEIAPTEIDIQPPSAILLSPNIWTDVMKILDFHSVQNLRLSCKSFNKIYKKGKTEICDSILSRTEEMFLSPQLRSYELTENSEFQLRRHYNCIDWIVNTIFARYYKVKEDYDADLVAQASLKELCGVYHASVPKYPQPDIVKGPTYPFPRLMKILLEKGLGSQQRRRNNLPRYFKELTALEKATLSDSHEIEVAMDWFLKLIRWHLSSSRIVYYAVNDHICNAEKDILADDESYDEYLLNLQPVQLWELVSLADVGEKERERMPAARKGKGKKRDVVFEFGEEDMLDVMEAFIRERVWQILGPKPG